MCSIILTAFAVYGSGVVQLV